MLREFGTPINSAIIHKFLNCYREVYLHCLVDSCILEEQLMEFIELDIVELENDLGELLRDKRNGRSYYLIMKSILSKWMRALDQNDVNYASKSVFCTSLNVLLDSYAYDYSDGDVLLVSWLE